MRAGSVLIVGGTRGLGLRLAETCAAAGEHVIITGREAERTASVAEGITGAEPVGAIALDLAEPHELADRLDEVGPVKYLVLAAIERGSNTLREFDISSAVRLVTLKLVGYTEVIHTLAPRLTEDAAVLLWGGLAMRRPYPGSTMVTAVNGAVSGLVRTLALELAPVRVNALHPGVVGDSPEWVEKTAWLEGLAERTPLGRLATMDECVDAALFLLRNTGVNGINLELDGGWMLN